MGEIGRKGRKERSTGGRDKRKGETRDKGRELYIIGLSQILYIQENKIKERASIDKQIKAKGQQGLGREETFQLW